MSLVKKSIRVAITVACAALALQAQAQLIRADVCSGSATVLSQQQDGTRVALEVEVTIEGCDDTCIGSLEYDLVLVDADNNETQWRMTENWDWKHLDGPFTLSLEQQILPNTQLKEVTGMRVGRCSCATVATDE
ncbi:MAG: hypothetical protein RLZZ227_1752 [Pseudomonadota bacterium]|jgi:hypothetical protein